ncbi:MAG: acyltransferase family protein [Chitinophagaceae bacterium]|nr:acyltransferase family protein [Chitinophagaceae bacterium]
MNTSLQSMNITTGRQAYLDWLRILSILGVLFFHSAMPFVTEWEWHIKNNETSRILMEFNFWLSRFRMPLLFFISGTVSYFLLQRKSGFQFIGLRFRRLLLPLIFGMFVIVPPQVYLERVNQGFTGNYFDFYPSIFSTGPYPNGNMSWHHLWFIAYLFVFDVICAPLFVWLMKGWGKKFTAWFGLIAKAKWIYTMAIPSIILYTALYFRFPETNNLINDWGRIFYWLFFLLAGFICIANPLLMESLQRNRKLSLAMALISFGIITYFRWNNSEPWEIIKDWKFSMWTYLYISLWGLTAWMWMFAAIGYGKQYLNKRHSVLIYINQAVYPFYILHQTIIVIVVFYIVKWQEAVLTKYLFTALVSLFFSIAIYHLLIRPYKLTRFLFGMKPKSKISPDVSRKL